MAATGFSRWQSQWAKRALQHFVITRFAFQVISCSAKDCLRNEHFRTNLGNMHHWPVQIWLYQSFRHVKFMLRIWQRIRLDSLPLIIWKWLTLASVSPLSTHFLPVVYPLSSICLLVVYPLSNHCLPVVYLLSTCCLPIVYLPIDYSLSTCCLPIV